MNTYGLPVEIDVPEYDIITCVDNNAKEVLVIKSDGRIFWNGREVETDDEFRAAMLELKEYLMGHKP